jgi:hypothetical protein
VHHGAVKRTDALVNGYACGSASRHIHFAEQRFMET